MSGEAEDAADGGETGETEAVAGETDVDAEADAASAEEPGAEEALDGSTDASDSLEAEVEELRSRVQELETDLAALDDDVNSKKMAMIATKGSLDMAYPPLILASTAAAFGWEVKVFHTFWGLDILHEKKSKNLQLSSVGNPNMPVPNLLAVLPGMDRMTTAMMRKKIKENDTASVEELVDTCLDTGVELQACQMTQDLMEYEEDDFYDGVVTGVGAATAFNYMADAEIQLMI